MYKCNLLVAVLYQMQNGQGFARFLQESNLTPATEANNETCAVNVQGYGCEI